MTIIAELQSLSPESSSTFTSPAVLEVLDDWEFKLLLPFEFYEGSREKPTAVHCVPAGFVTDLASVPHWLWSFLQPTGRYTKAAILHDWLIRSDSGVSRADADRIFYDAMMVLGVKPRLAWLMYRAVRIYSIYSEFPNVRLSL